MQQAQQYRQMLQGYQMPISGTKQTVGSTGYSNSPLSQMAGLLSLLAGYNPNATGTTTNQTSSDLGVVQQGVNLASSIKRLFGLAEGGSVSGYADGGAVNPQVAYTDGQGNYYDASGYLVE
jgi:hypothetical protein